MRHTKYIILFIVLILTILVVSNRVNSATVCTENSLGDQTCITTNTTTIPGVTTDNLLSPNFQDGSWTNSSNQQFHGSNYLATTNESTSSSTVSLSTDGGLSKTQINSGFSSTFGLDIWFWSGYTSSVTMKQTLTTDTGTVITQQRVVSGTSDYGKTYTDTVIVASNSANDYSIKAEINTSVPGTSTMDHLGPDINNPTLYVTTNSTTSTSTSETFTYCYDRVPNACTYDNTALKEIESLKTDDGKTYDQYVEDAIKLDDFKIETTVLIEDEFGKIEEIKIEDYAVEAFTSFIETNGLTETFETALVEEGLGKEEFFETMTDSIKEEFGDEFKSDNNVETENLTTENTTIEASNDTTTETKVEETPSETNTESQTSETVSTESNVDKDTETKGAETKANNEETVDAKTNTDVKTNGGSSIDTRSIEKKVERIIAKVISKLKDVDKKLQAVQYITTQGIKSGEADISNYINRRIYSNANTLNDPLADDFFQKINILEQQQIYKDVSLVAYESNDPIAVKQRLTVEVESEISRIQAELYALKQKRGS